MQDIERNSIALRFKNKVYAINASFPLVHEIEGELGSIAVLQERFSHMSWEISELVTLTHMMLQAAGETVDYLALGNLMLKEGLRPYLAAAQKFLQLAISGQEVA
ncbi:MAG: gene transfer agent family protein [Proteobacteria bacterium]|nr:gene transfer agent family protein [Pseudomonadota bacterium]